VDLPAGRVDPQWADLDRGAHIIRAPPQQRVKAGDQFVDFERLDQVIVGPGLETILKPVPEISL